MFKAFKEFAFKGNLIDMAVGIIIGGAFGTVVKSLVDNVIMPPIGKLIGDIDFSRLRIPLTDKLDDKGNPEVAIYWGQFLQDFVSFLIIAFVLFIIIKKVIAAFDKKENETPEEDPGPTEVDLLTEIRDQLKKQGS